MINCSIPAFLSNFSAAEDNRTYADLKVFYKGETCDGRVFDDEFAEKMKATLPYTPVVAFYSDLKDDFIGHNSTQYIYGLVRHDANIRYEADEDGKEWLVTSVMLYTDRVDNIGKVAEKIVGKQQSLEIDPNTVKYEVFKENGKSKVRFTEGRFVGLSVLGDKEKPAFTGSEFFMAHTDFSELREKFENFFSFLQNDRGAQMKLEQFTALAEFAKLSYSQKMEVCQKELSTQLGDNYWSYIVDMYDDKFVACVIDETGDVHHNFYAYNFNEDGSVILNDGGKAFQTFVTAEQLDYLSSFATKENESEKEEPVKEEPEEFSNPEEPEKDEEPINDCAVAPVEDEKEEGESQCEDDKECRCTDDADEKDAPESSDENPIEDKESKESDDEDFSNSAEKDPKVDTEEPADKEPKDEENAKDKDEESKCTSLSDSERQELEAYRKEKKQGLIDSFKDQLDRAVLDSFSANIDSYDYSSLEVALALAFTKANKNRQPQQTQVLPFSFGSMFATQVEKQEKTFSDLIRERTNK